MTITMDFVLMELGGNLIIHQKNMVDKHQGDLETFRGYKLLEIHRDNNMDRS